MFAERLVVIVAAIAFSAMAVPARAATIQIVMENLVISPAEASAKVGDTIEWTNKDNRERLALSTPCRSPGASQI
jgi:plastocyanin